MNSANQDTRLRQLVTNSVPYKAVEKAANFLFRACALKPRVVPMDLLKPGELRRALWVVAEIDGWMSVSSALLHGYASWLGRWRRNTERRLIIVDENLCREVLLSGVRTATTRAQSKFLAIIAHEVGHVFMGHVDECKFVEDMGAFVGADWQSLKAESEAWLFAGFLRAFVFADIGGGSRPPDNTFKYV